MENFTRDEAFVELMLLAHFPYKHQQQRADIQIQLEGNVREPTY